MTHHERCESVLRKMIDEANANGRVILEEDFGGNTITIFVGDSHTHCGIPGDDSFERLVEQLYNSLHGGPGLSWHTERIEECTP